ncbi:MAG: hypothetical protein U5K37_04400 [Natrialbaceae archaeon]|nr:hypothetical protein [Natrialbaceae archaeon]
MYHEYDRREHTVQLPFPSEATGGGAIEDIWIYSDTGEELDGWDPTVVETEQGPMLEVSTESLPGTTRSYLFLHGGWAID